MKTNKHFKTIHISIIAGEKNAEVIFMTSFFTDVGKIGSFFIPATSIYSHDVIKFRAKHDLGITYDHSSISIKHSK